MPELQLYKGVVYLWAYIPNLPAAIVFAILFALATAAHMYKMFRTRMWFCIPFVIGGICEPIGYTCRAIATYNTGSLVPSILQGIFLLLPPVLFAASLYMVYSRVVRAVHGESFSPITMRWSTRFFVLGDWFCLNVQSSGAGLLAKPENVRIGDAIIVAGLGMQCVIFVGFMYCCISFHGRFRRHLIAVGEEVDIPWQSVLFMLYGTSLLITVRNVFRLVEYIMGKNSYLFDNEWPVYVFDGVLMLVVMVVFFVWYPSKLQERNRESMIELVSNGDGPEEQGGGQKPSGSAVPVFARRR